MASGFPRESKIAVSRYLLDERTQLCSDVCERANALAALVSSKRPDRILSQNSTASVAPDDETPEQWAARVSSEPAYLVAGIMFDKTPILAETGRKFDCPLSFLDMHLPNAFRLVRPPTQEVANTYQCVDPGELATQLGGLQIAVRSMTWAGTLQSVLVDTNGHWAERPPTLVRYPRPNSELAKTSAGKWILNWESDLAKCEDPIVTRRVGDVTPSPSIYFSGGQGIEDYLEALSNSADVPVVSDGFRVPILGKAPPATGGVLRDWLEQFKESQKCFVRVTQGSVVVRHGGFWDLRQIEPSEDVLTRFENLPHRGLNDYADLAFSRLLAGSIEAGAMIPPFFESKQIPLTRFDSKPLRDSYLALAAFGQMTDNQRLHILNGGYVDLHRNVVDRTDTNVTDQAFRDTKGRLRHWYTESTTIHQEGKDSFLEPSAVLGLFYGGKPTQGELRLLESCKDSSGYLKLWGASPDDDPHFVSTYGSVMGKHAYYLSLKEILSSSKNPLQEADRTITGTFTFFASVDSDDGVLNQVVIPDK